MYDYLICYIGQWKPRMMAHITLGKFISTSEMENKSQAEVCWYTFEILSVPSRDILYPVTVTISIKDSLLDLPFQYIQYIIETKAKNYRCLEQNIEEKHFLRCMGNTITGIQKKSLLNKQVCYQGYEQSGWLSLNVDGACQSKGLSMEIHWFSRGHSNRWILRKFGIRWWLFSWILLKYIHQTSTDHGMYKCIMKINLIIFEKCP